MLSIKDMLEASIEHFGLRDIVTVMLSQKLDKEIVKQQKLINEGCTNVRRAQ